MNQNYINDLNNFEAICSKNHCLYVRFLQILHFSKFCSVPISLIRNIVMCYVCSLKSKEIDDVEFCILVTEYYCKQLTVLTLQYLVSALTSFRLLSAKHRN